jgi:hypothetical protein
MKNKIIIIDNFKSIILSVEKEFKKARDLKDTYVRYDLEENGVHVRYLDKGILERLSVKDIDDFSIVSSFGIVHHIDPDSETEKYFRTLLIPVGAQSSKYFLRYHNWTGEDIQHRLEDKRPIEILTSKYHSLSPHGIPSRVPFTALHIAFEKSKKEN